MRIFLIIAICFSFSFSSQGRVKPVYLYQIINDPEIEVILAEVLDIKTDKPEQPKKINDTDHPLVKSIKSRDIRITSDNVKLNILDSTYNFPAIINAKISNLSGGWDLIKIKKGKHYILFLTLDGYQLDNEFSITDNDLNILFNKMSQIKKQRVSMPNKQINKD